MLLEKYQCCLARSVVTSIFQPGIGCLLSHWYNSGGWKLVTIVVREEWHGSDRP